MLFARLLDRQIKTGSLRVIDALGKTHAFAGAEMGFRHEDQMVFQIQLAKSQHAVPLTRDYISDWKRANAGHVTEAA